MKATLVATYSTFFATVATAASMSSPETGALIIASVCGSSASAAVSLRRERKKYYAHIEDLSGEQAERFKKQKLGDMALAVFLSLVLGMGLGFFGADAFVETPPDKWYSFLAFKPTLTAVILSAVASRLFEWFIDDGINKLIRKLTGGEQ